MKFLFVEGTRAVERSTIVEPTLSQKLKNQKPASAKEWGTHFLVKDTKTVKRG